MPIRYKKADMSWKTVSLIATLFVLFMIVIAVPNAFTNSLTNVREMIGFGEDKETLSEQENREIAKLADNIESCYESECRGITFTSSVSGITEGNLIKELSKNNQVQDKDWNSLFRLNVPLIEGNEYSIYYIPEATCGQQNEGVQLTEKNTDPCKGKINTIKILRTEEPSEIKSKAYGKWRFSDEFSKEENEHIRNYIYIYFDAPFEGWDENIGIRSLDAFGRYLSIYKSKGNWNIFRRGLPNKQSDWDRVCSGRDCILSLRAAIGDPPTEGYYVALTNLESNTYYHLEFEAPVDVRTSVIQFEIE